MYAKYFLAFVYWNCNILHLQQVAYWVRQHVFESDSWVQVDDISRVPVPFPVAGNMAEVIRHGQCVHHQWQEAAVYGGALQHSMNLWANVNLLLPCYACAGRTIQIF